MTEDCHKADCECEDWPPTECPQCGVTFIGASPQDWWVHFDSDCEYLGKLYCFVEKPDGVTIK